MKLLSRDAPAWALGVPLVLFECHLLRRLCGTPKAILAVNPDGFSPKLRGEVDKVVLDVAHCPGKVQTCPPFRKYSPDAHGFRRDTIG